MLAALDQRPMGMKRGTMLEGWTLQVAWGSRFGVFTVYGLMYIEETVT
jgi:hypothetical protein